MDIALYQHCKKGKGYFDSIWLPQFTLSACFVKHSGVPLPALNSKQVKDLICFSRTLANVMGKYFASEIVQSSVAAKFSNTV